MAAILCTWRTLGRPLEKKVHHPKTRQKLSGQSPLGVSEVVDELREQPFARCNVAGLQRGESVEGELHSRSMRDRKTVLRLALWRTAALTWCTLGAFGVDEFTRVLHCFALRCVGVRAFIPNS
jgi:hypothetical protein